MKQWIFLYLKEKLPLFFNILHTCLKLRKFTFYTSFLMCVLKNKINNVILKNSFVGATNYMFA